MRALRLDYHATAAKFRFGSLVLAIGTLIVSATLFEYRTLHEEMAAWEAKITDVRKSAKRGVPAAPRNTADEQAAAQDLKAARAALQRLALPWDDLLVALESVPGSGVALLAVEPDPDKSTVKITAEAKSDSDMLAYLKRLQAVDRLADVSLASHQIKAGDPLKVLRFVVVATWVMQT